MKTPPLLLGATLLFWGWQTGLAIPGVIMAALYESARWLKFRWEFSDEDFARVWVFCSVLLLAAAVYAFTSNEAPSDFHGFFENPNLLTSRSSGTASTRTAMTIVRWLPMIFFLFVVAQVYSSRGGVPLETIVQILRYRWTRSRRVALAGWQSRSVNVSYPFLILCLFSASAHGSENTNFFWGFCLLVAWALWQQRSPRFGIGIWIGSLLAAVALGYVGQNGMGHLQNYLSNLNPEWLASFTRRRFDPSRSRTELGKIGRVQTSGTIVIRLQAKTGRPPSLLREATYPFYKQQTWYADTSESDFERVNEDAKAGTFQLLRDKTNQLSAVTIGCYLEDGKALLPLPEGTCRLENLVAFDLQKSWLGAVLVQGPGLVVFDAFFGPGSTLDAPANTNIDLSVPPREFGALDEVISELGLDHQTTPQALKTLDAFFQQRFTYSTWQDAASTPGALESPLARFLLKTHKGHCEYFATAGVLLLRRAGIPTRYAVGYAVHEKSGRNYLVRQRDAHAWCLVWDNASQSWRDFDPTPVSWFAAEAQRASAWQALSDVWSRITFEVSKFRWGQGHLRRYLLLGVAAVLLVLLYQILFQRWRRGRPVSRLQTDIARIWPGLDSEFFELETRLIKRGFIREPSEPLSEWLQRAAAHPALADLSASLRQLLGLHYRHRFDPWGLTDTEREALRCEAQICLVKIQALSSSAQPGLESRL